MTTYTAIATADIDQDSPVTQPLMTLLRDNHLGVIEMDATAVTAGALMANGWQVEDGAGGTDPIYDFAVDGSVANVETPDFVDGFDYKLILIDCGSGFSGDHELQLYRDGLASYSSVAALYTASYAWAEIEILNPRLSSEKHLVKSAYATGLTTAGSSVVSVTHSSADTVSKARFSHSVTNIGQGQIYLLKRGEYFTR